MGKKFLSAGSLAFFCELRLQVMNNDEKNRDLHCAERRNRGREGRNVSQAVLALTHDRQSLSITILGDLIVTGNTAKSVDSKD